MALSWTSPASLLAVLLLAGAACPATAFFRPGPQSASAVGIHQQQHARSPTTIARAQPPPTLASCRKCRHPHQRHQQQRRTAAGRALGASAPTSAPSAGAATTAASGAFAEELGVLDEEQAAMMAEECILVDRNDRPTGSASKVETHLTSKGLLLHRAFSVFLFDKKGRVLMQRRADSKHTFAGYWTNTCCSAIFLGQIFSPLVYLTLVPVVAGVALASLKELDFKWAALGGAMGSNLAASTRAILSKRSMGMDMGKNMSPANLYAVLTIMASAMLLPLSAMVEGPKIKDLWESTVTTPEKGNEIIYNTVASGVFFYLYNEVAFRCLGVVHPVTHAVGNTFKRVFLIATSIIVFKSKLTPLAAMGSFMAIAGVLLYSLTKEWCAKQDAIKAQAHK